MHLRYLIGLNSLWEKCLSIAKVLVEQRSFEGARLEIMKAKGV